MRLTRSSVDGGCRKDTQLQCIGGFARCRMEKRVEVLVHESDCLDDESHNGREVQLLF